MTINFNYNIKIDLFIHMIIKFSILDFYQIKMIIKLNYLITNIILL